MHAHASTVAHTPPPPDEEYLIKTPNSSKPFAATFLCRSTEERVARRGNKTVFSEKYQQIYDELWELKPTGSHASLWHLRGSANHTFLLLTSTSHYWFSYLLMHNMSSSKQNTDDYQGHEGDVMHHLAQTNWTVSLWRDQTWTRTSSSRQCEYESVIFKHLLFSFSFLKKGNVGDFSHKHFAVKAPVMIHFDAGKKRMSNSNPNDLPCTFNFMDLASSKILSVVWYCPYCILSRQVGGEGKQVERNW